MIILRRLTASELDGVLNHAQWPSDFDHYETLLRIGRAAGHKVQWVDPVDDSSLQSTMVDLARARPGISVAELAELLDLDKDIAAVIADKARIAEGVSITDDEPWR